MPKYNTEHAGYNAYMESQDASEKLNSIPFLWCIASSAFCAYAIYALGPVGIFASVFIATAGAAIINGKRWRRFLYWQNKYTAIVEKNYVDERSELWRKISELEKQIPAKPKPENPTTEWLKRFEILIGKREYPRDPESGRVLWEK